jgi:hypothetical protein
MILDTKSAVVSRAYRPRADSGITLGEEAVNVVTLLALSLVATVV